MHVYKVNIFFCMLSEMGSLGTFIFGASGMNKLNFPYNHRCILMILSHICHQSLLPGSSM